jgi:hypothetical protein
VQSLVSRSCSENRGGNARCWQGDAAEVRRCEARLKAVMSASLLGHHDAPGAVGEIAPEVTAAGVPEDRQAEAVPRIPGRVAFNGSGRGGSKIGALAPVMVGLEMEPQS